MEANKTLLRRKYGRIVERFAAKAGLPLEEALAKFYDSQTFMLIDEGVADLHCMSEDYLADELLLEYHYTTPTTPTPTC